MRSRVLHDGGPQSLEEALERAVIESGQPTKAIADGIGCRHQYLCDALNPHNDDVQFQLRRLLPFMRATGSTAPLEYLARMMGGVFVRVPDATSDHTDIRKAFVDVVRELGEDAAVIEQVLADGRVDPAEAERVAQELDDTVAALVAVKTAVERKVARVATPTLRTAVGSR